MLDYAEMYYRLFNAITRAIEILQQAQQDAEELYISEKQPDFQLFHFIWSKCLLL